MSNVNNRSSLLGSQLMSSTKKAAKLNNEDNSNNNGHMGLETGIYSSGHIRTVVAPLKDSSSQHQHVRTLIAPLKDSSRASGIGAAMKKDKSNYSKSLGTDGEESSRFLSSSFKAERRSSAQTSSSMIFSGYLLKRSNHPFSFPKEVTTTISNNNDTRIESAATATTTSAAVARNNDIMPPMLPSLLPNTTITTTALPNTNYNHRIINMDININSPIDEYAIREEDEIDLATSMAAAFFGVMDEIPITTKMTLQSPPPPIVNVTSNPRIQRRSATQPMPLPKRNTSASSDDSIKLQQQLNRNNNNNNISRIHRQISSPESTNYCSTPPPDYVDPTDGHIWRAKFCVLENGILYFYRHDTDAYSPEAKRERCTTSLFDDSLSSSPSNQRKLQQEDAIGSKHDFLSKSPMPRNYMQLAQQLQSSSPTNLQESFHADPNVIWEKKASLDSVGAVRSAEDDFGINSFVLLTENNSIMGGTDCLILKAASQEDMQEWLFQFHCTLATFMTHIVKTYIAPNRSFNDGNKSSSNNWVGQHTKHHHNHLHSSEDSSLGVLPTSKLSHGHGKVQMMRKMRAEKRSRGTVTSSLGGGDVSPALSSSPREIITTPPTIYDTYPTSFANKPAALEKQPIIVVTKKEAEPQLAVVKPKKKYIPPFKRKNFKPPGTSLACSSTKKESTATTTDNKKSNIKKSISNNNKKVTTDKEAITISPQHQPHASLKLGGCADTTLFGSILDIIYNQSILGKKIKYPYKSNPYGTFSTSSSDKNNLKWEVGAISERGVRESNEDAFLICSDLVSINDKEEIKNVYPDPSSLFAIFDGHCGDQAARYASETFTKFLHESIVSLQQNDGNIDNYNIATKMEEAMKHAIERLDTSICNICQEGGRDWGCGATALITLLVKDTLILANVGDCRGVFCTSTAPSPETSDWNELPHNNNGTIANTSKSHHWKTLTQVHSPSRPFEKARIEEANGWLTVEHESCLAGQLHRIDFCDDDVVNLLKRWFSDRFDNNYNNGDSNGNDSNKNKDCERSADSADPKRILKISRVCGELSVSRALGDRDFKAAFNPVSSSNNSNNDEVHISSNKTSWEGPDWLLYPKAHSMKFQDDLISGKPDVEVMTVMPGFLILACDGLWDVMDPFDAVLVTKDLIYDKGWSAKKAAARLAELAIHLGSSDNTTVILLRFYGVEEDVEPTICTNEITSNR